MYLADEHKIWVCKGEDKICMLPKMANRHGLIAGSILLVQISSTL